VVDGEGAGDRQSVTSATE